MGRNARRALVRDYGPGPPCSTTTGIFSTRRSVRSLNRQRSTRVAKTSLRSFSQPGSTRGRAPHRPARRGQGLSLRSATWLSGVP